MAKRRSRSVAQSGRSENRDLQGITASAKERLDKLIRKSRDQFYKPIAVAEILFRRRSRLLAFEDVDEYRRPSDRWAKEISTRLWGYATASNGRYWDQLFDENLMSLETLKRLAAVNEARDSIAVVEKYIYRHLLDKLNGILYLVALIDPRSAETFDFRTLVTSFERDRRYSNSIDKLYEVAVYALFSVVTKRLEATVTLQIKADCEILDTFDDFAQMVLGVCKAHPSVTQPAKLFRVGKANASDGGLDMWANFGPAVQVKHIALTEEACEAICDRVYADKIIIVCKAADASVIRSVMTQVGLGDKIRGIIPEIQLAEWFSQACSMSSDSELGVDLLTVFREEMESEFSTTNSSAVSELQSLYEERRYSDGGTPESWGSLWAL